MYQGTISATVSKNIRHLLASVLYRNKGKENQLFRKILPLKELTTQEEL